LTEGEKRTKTNDFVRSKTPEARLGKSKREKRRKYGKGGVLFLGWSQRETEESPRYNKNTEKTAEAGGGGRRNKGFHHREKRAHDGDADSEREQKKGHSNELFDDGEGWKLGIVKLQPETMIGGGGNQKKQKERSATWKGEGKFRQRIG